MRAIQQPSPADAVVLPVEDWPGTFAVPDDAEDRLRPGPVWVVPAGAVLGLLLAAAVRELEVPPAAVWLLMVPVFVTCAAVLVLGLGGPRGSTTTTAVATAAWVPAVAAVLVAGALDERLVAVLVLVGIVGQVGSDLGVRARLAGQRAAVRAGRGGTRTQGWVVATSGPPWDKVLRVEASGGEGGPWTGRNGGWRTVRPGPGHPVSIWRPDQPGAAVVLLPRDPR